MMKIKQENIIKTVRIAFIVVIVIFMGFSAYNSFTNSEKNIVIAEKRSACSSCPNSKSCSKNKSQKVCSTEQKQNVKNNE
jgi:hypothetical protein